jgi:hypothetical protein
LRCEYIRDKDHTKLVLDNLEFRCKKNKKEVR